MSAVCPGPSTWRSNANVVLVPVAGWSSVQLMTWPPPGAGVGGSEHRGSCDRLGEGAGPGRQREIQSQRLRRRLGGSGRGRGCTEPGRRLEGGAREPGGRAALCDGHRQRAPPERAGV